MFLEIVTPEAVLFSSKVDAVSVPGIDGEFQVLNNHASIVSTLKEGTIKIHTHSIEHLKLDDFKGYLVAQKDDEKIWLLQINSGTIELNNNKAIILAD